MLNEHLGDLDDFISKNIGLINKVAYSYTSILSHFNGNIDIDDIFQVASIGFTKAYNRFDPINFKNEKGEPLKFSTYAYPMMHGEIRRFLKDFNTGAKIPRSYKEKIFNFLKNKLNFDDNYDLIMSTMNWTLEETKEFLLYFKTTNCLYLDTPLDFSSNDGEETVGSLIQDNTDINKMNENLILSDFKKFLNPSQLKVYELLVNQQLSQSEAGSIVGVSQVQISRIFAQILSIAEEYGKEEFMRGQKTSPEVDQIVKEFIYQNKKNVKELHRIIECKGYSINYNTARTLYKKIKKEIDDSIELKKLNQSNEKFEEILIKKNSIPVNSLIDEITRISNYLNTSEALINLELRINFL